MELEPKGILILTGTVGTGKTTVAAKIGEQLADAGLPNAVVDLCR
jgi:adenylylsulfate kinase-like enzyme